MLWAESMAQQLLRDCSVSVTYHCTRKNTPPALKIEDEKDTRQRQDTF